MEIKLYTVTEVLELIPLSTTGLYKAIQNGDIDSHKLGRRRVFTARALIDYVNKVTCQKFLGGAQ
jgi:excisionase family DNA binding protein